jgi:type IV pilus assembly protein PilY1
MEVDMVTGGRLDYSVFDVNKDTKFTNADNVNVGGVGIVPVSGIKSAVGIIKTPGIVSAGEVEYKYAGGTSGGIMVTPEKGDSGSGRQSWRQLR